MKKYLVVAFVVLCFNANAQISLEHTYDSAGTFNTGGPNNTFGQAMIIKFELSGERYVRINRWGKTMDIYDMNHVWMKKISLASLPSQTGGTPGEVLYLSEQLFNLDSKMEFMYFTNNPLYLGIYDESGTLLFSDTTYPAVHPNWHMQQYPIYNTTQGTKMILSCGNSNGTPPCAKVFSLPGTLTTGIQNGNDQLVQAQGGAISNLYPNPTSGVVTLQYELPKGETSGEIVLYSQQGAEVKRYKVDNTFNDLLLDNTMLPAGTYFYQLQTSKGAVGSKKMVVIK